MVSKLGLGIGLQKAGESISNAILENKQNKLKSAASKDAYDIEKYKAETDRKKYEKDLELLKLDQVKLLLEVSKDRLSGRNNISPEEKDFWVKTLKDKAQIENADTLFSPIKNEKDGVIKSYAFPESDPLTKDIERREKEENAEKAKAETAKIKLETLQREQGLWVDPSQPLMLAIKNTIESDKYKNANWEERNKMLSLTSFQFATQGTNVPSPLAKAAETEVDKSIMSLQDQLFNLKLVSDSYHEGLLTWGAKLKGYSLNTIAKIDPSKLSDDSKNFVGEMWYFQSNLGRFFDAYRLEVTKSQAAMRELETLRKNILNTEMSDPQFQYGLERTFDRLNRQLRLKRMIKRKGLSDDEFWTEFDKSVALPGDPSLSPEEIKKRGDEVALSLRAKKPNASKGEIINLTDMVLRQEGYKK